MISRLGLLYFCVSDVECTTQSLNNIELNGFLNFKLSLIPFGVVVSMIWVYFLISGMAYYQLCTWINRQYEYLHEIEIQLSQAIQAKYFSREGVAYKNKYPLFLDWVWVLYTYVFPVILLLTSVRILFLEWICSNMEFNLYFDAIVGLLFLITVALFRYDNLLKKMRGIVQRLHKI